MNDDVVRLAKWFSLRCEGHPAARRLGLDLDDLAQEFALALLAAAPTYDPSRGAYTTWAVWRMRGRWSQIRERARRRPELVHAEHEPAARPAPEPLDLSLLDARGRRLLALRADGYTYQQMGLAVGVSKQAAREATLAAARVLCGG
jgi:DNA-directed RNA polymerase specialized sigma24 family protein